MKFKSRVAAVILEISLLLSLPVSTVTALEPTGDIAGEIETALPETTAPTAETESPVLSDDAEPSPRPDFTDVLGGEWFYDDVARLVAEGIIHGYPDGSFRPDENITYAEFTKMLVTAVGGEITVEKTNLFEGHWSADYINFAYEQGIITVEDIADGFIPDAPIPRSRMTKMMVLALGIPLVKIENPFLDLQDTPDIYADTAYNEYLLRGYPAENGYRIYDGEASASRSEASAITVRIMDYKAAPYEYRRDAILENASNNILLGESELIDLFYILNREFITDFTFETPIPYEEWSEYYKLANIIHLEYFYTAYLHCTYVPNKNRYTIKFEYGDDAEKLKNYASATDTKAKEVISKIITEGMSDTDKIRAIHDYIVLNCKYDYDNYLTGTMPFETRLAYGVLVNGSAICQGYSAAFNLLCKTAGLRSIVVTGRAPANPDNHAWNAVLIDGVIYFVDVTHDDPVPDTEGRVYYDHFLLGEEELARLGYSWNGSHTLTKYVY